MKLVRTAFLTAALSLAALPASAVAGPPAAGTPSAADSPREARALARAACAEFKVNFESRQQFGKCVAAATRVARTKVSPGRSCREQGLSRKRQAGQARSDFNACVQAAAHAKRAVDEAEEEESEEGDVEESPAL
jgi:hypothetical protein